jgi:hypothetical protein
MGETPAFNSQAYFAITIGYRERPADSGLAKTAETVLSKALTA